MIETMSLLGSDGFSLLAQSEGTFWMPQQAAGNEAVDAVFHMILWICTFFFFLVVGLMGFFAVRYRRRPGVPTPESPSSNTKLEIFWTVIPIVVVSVIFYQGMTVYMEMQQAPPDCREIRVSARQWSWNFSYPNGHIDNELHVPANEPVKLIMTSEDVLHGLWIPAMRVKMDLVPGRYTSVWFRPNRVGEYQLLCTEYCGKDHSNMLTKVVVQPRDEYEAWLKDAANYLEGLTPVEQGQALYQRRGCSQCHSIDGTAGTGPSFLGIFGETHDLADGSSVLVDDNYIRESILDPQKKVRSGYQSVMSTYQGLVSDENITSLIEFIKSLE